MHITLLAAIVFLSGLGTILAWLFHLIDSTSSYNEEGQHWSIRYSFSAIFLVALVWTISYGNCDSRIENVSYIEFKESIVNGEKTYLAIYKKGTKLVYVNGNQEFKCQIDPTKHKLKLIKYDNGPYFGCYAIADECYKLELANFSKENTK